jgi:hypothetical protein
MSIEVRPVGRVAILKPDDRSVVPPENRSIFSTAANRSSAFCSAFAQY